MRVIVCGGRAFRNAELIRCTLRQFMATKGLTAIAHGGASGVDSLADLFGRHWGLPVRTYLPEWRKHGVQAGPLRNERMLSDFRPDAVIAFPGNEGTADMVTRALRAGVPVYRVTESGDMHVQGELFAAGAP